MAIHVQKVLQGEYEVSYHHPAPVILDIGANVGSFAAWALERWPGCFVHCYEPSPANFELLRSNLRQVDGLRVALNQYAIGDPERTRLFLGKNNCGEASFFDLGEQTSEFIEVVTKEPAVLPRAHILKIDAEGSEIDVLSRLPAIEMDVVMLEYHSEENRRKVDLLLPDHLLIGGHVRCLHRGVLKYVHRRLLG
jgi:FkbM family methyltransferase